MPTDTTRPRPPAGGLEAAHGPGRVLEIDGITYLVQEDGGLVKLAQGRGTLTPERRREVADEIAAAALEVNPAGNPYRTGLA